jgi:hypothetical protein
VTFPNGQADSFTHSRTSQLPKLQVVVIALLAIEAPVIHWLILANVEPLWVHALYWVSQVACVAWILFQRWALGRSAHRIEAGRLILQVGARPTTEVALANIASARVEDPPSSDPFAKQRPRRDALWVTPFETPNTCLELVEPIGVRRRFRSEQRARRLRLYLDDPDSFVARVESCARSVRSACQDFR